MDSSVLKVLASRWYRAASKQKAGQITAAGETTDVGFEQVAGEVNDRIDAAYRAKYASSPSLKPMIGDRARAATVRISPRTLMQLHQEGETWKSAN